ncbi:MAG TPA: 50S ribosomal protein L20 [Candidatus Pacearchaeota archaeon]|jgi:large subunit ribosomal protein L20|nr:50S ribosomal protein L20 [Candidatus Pacearchaeota archaeon]
MPRVKRGTLHKKRRRNIIEYTKGFKWGRKSKLASAKQAMMKALSYNYRDRKVKKRETRSLWNIHINAFCRKNGITYSRFINAMKTNNIAIDRKILSEFSAKYPHLFEAVLGKTKR